jgi:hypothetical protein
MTFKLERERGAIRLIGFVQAEHLPEITDQLQLCGTGAAIDLDGVTICGVEVVRFLLARERQGTPLRNCPAYIRAWIDRERTRSG